MFSSLKLGKVFGIDLYVHGTFWLLPLLVLFGDLMSGGSVTAAGGEVVFLLAVFGCIALHELGHALAARAYGVKTRDITLYPVGGVASLERMPEKPSQEVAIALAGPAVNLVIAGLLFGGLLLADVLAPRLADSAEAAGIGFFAMRLLAANLVLAVFNLLPCFPMDGGRVLRAVLATRLNRVRATEIAVRVGTVVAAGFVVLGVLYAHFGLILVAIVAFLLGQAELAGVRAQAYARDVQQRVAEWFARPGDSGTASGPTNDFSGLEWDETRRVWLQYENGRVVRVIEPK